MNTRGLLNKWGADIFGNSLCFCCRLFAAFPDGVGCGWNGGGAVVLVKYLVFVVVVVAAVVVKLPNC